jgi:hypothetical protein
MHAHLADTHTVDACPLGRHSYCICMPTWQTLMQYMHLPRHHYIKVHSNLTISAENLWQWSNHTFEELGMFEGDVLKMERALIYVSVLMQDGSFRTVKIKKNQQIQVCTACMMHACVPTCLGGGACAPQCACFRKHASSILRPHQSSESISLITCKAPVLTASPHREYV